MALDATLSRKERCSLAAKEKSDHYHRRAGLQLRLESSEDSGEETTQIRPPHRRTSEGRGWSVDPTVHVITVGVRATVPIIEMWRSSRTLVLKISQRSRKSRPAWRT